MTNHWLAFGTLVLVLGLALGYDLATRRIPNWIVVSALIAAVVLNMLASSMADIVAGTWTGFGKSLLGAITGLAIMLPLYMLHALGAGDVKLMAAVGAFLGPVQTVGAALLVFLAGGVLSIAAAFCSGTVNRVADNLHLMSLHVMTGHVGLTREVRTTGRLPYALAIAAGTGLQIWFATLAGWPFK